MLDDLGSRIGDARDLLALAVEEGDSDTIAAVFSDLESVENLLRDAEFRRMFSGETDD